MSAKMPVSTRAWVAFCIVSSFYFFQYILRVFPSIAMQDIMQHFHIDAAVFGQFSGFYYIGYAAVHIPIGLLLDRVGPRIVLPLCLTLIAIGMFPLWVSDFWIYPLLGRLLVGMGSSGAILSVFKVLHSNFPTEQFTKVLSFSVIIGLLGAIYGGGPLYLMLASMGFEQLVLALSGTALILGILAWFLTPSLHQNELPSLSVSQEIRVVLLNPKVFLLCLFSGLMVGPLEGFADVWGKEFFKHVFGFSDVQSASLPSLLFFGMCFGGPLLSWFAEYNKRHLKVLIGCGLSMCLGFLYILFVHVSGTLMLSVVLFGIGMLSAYQIIAIYLASTFVPHESAGLASAVANMVIMTFGYLFHVTIGKVVQVVTAQSGFEQGLYNGLMVIPVGLLLGTLGLLWFYLRYERAKPFA